MTLSRFTCARWLFVLFTLAGQTVVAQEATSPKPATPPVVEAQDQAAPTGTRRALIICGLPGDADHRKLFSEMVETLSTGLSTNYGFQSDQIQVLWAEAPTEKDPAAVRSSKQIATRETIPAVAAELRGQLGPDDTLWVFTLGHAHFDGKHSWLNLAGRDMNHLEFGAAFADLKCREQVFFMTTSCSGYYIKALAQPGRIVISATEADLEVNETLFPQKLVKAIGAPPAMTDLDMDRDDQFTIFDLYLFTARETALEYAGGELLATEHALLDDTGDGRGTELQIDYLTEAQGGRKRPGAKPVPPPQGDGKLSRQVPLALPLSLTRPESPAPPPLPIDN